MDNNVRCKPGDLALVVAAMNAENIGQIVEVLATSTGKPFKLKQQGHAWHVRCPGGHAGLHYRYDDGRLVVHNEGPALDSTLHPLRGEAGKPQDEMARVIFVRDQEPLITICRPQLP